MTNLRIILSAAAATAMLMLAVFAIIERRSAIAWRDKYARLEASYKTASADAQELQRQKVVFVQGEQRNITADVEEDHATNLAALRSDRDRLFAIVERLRAQANRGAPGASGTSEVPDSARIADGADLCIPADTILSAQEIELNKNALIEWIERQSQVDFGGGDAGH